VMCSPEFVRLWTFICAHGERLVFSTKLDTNLGKKFMHGRCISQARADSEYYTSHIADEKYPGFVLEYAEGLSSVSFLSLHAWGVLRNTRHAYVCDRTWEIDHSASEHVWYQGVSFSHEFLDWVRFKQRAERYRHTRPYLTSGCSCLTYEPLLNGELEDFRIHEGDRDYAVSLLVSFHDAVVGYAKRNQRK
jgi:hypothetical protein